jgi:hypothetical protein
VRGPLGHRQACPRPSASGTQPHRDPGEGIQLTDAAAQERVRLGDVLDIHRLGQDVFERAAPAQTGHCRTQHKLSGYPTPGPGSCRGRYHTDEARRLWPSAA